MLTVVLVAGCSGGSPAPAPAPAVPSAAGSPSAVDDPPGTVACGLLGVAVRDATLMRPGVVDAVGAAGATADAPVLEAADRLAAAYRAAVASRGTDREPDAVAAVSAAAAEMSGVCADSGLETAG